jgi:hypothetical protein
MESGSGKKTATIFICAMLRLIAASRWVSSIAAAAVTAPRNRSSTIKRCSVIAVRSLGKPIRRCLLFLWFDPGTRRNRADRAASDAVSGGGYFMVGTVISADMDLIGQLQAHSPAKFVKADMSAALQAARPRSLTAEGPRDFELIARKNLPMHHSCLKALVGHRHLTLSAAGASHHPVSQPCATQRARSGVKRVVTKWS